VIRTPAAFASFPPILSHQLSQRWQTVREGIQTSLCTVSLSICCIISHEVSNGDSTQNCQISLQEPIVIPFRLTSLCSVGQATTPAMLTVSTSQGDFALFDTGFICTTAHIEFLGRARG
jgi:hypothetical protein